MESELPCLSRCGFKRSFSFPFTVTAQVSSASPPPAHGDLGPVESSSLVLPETLRAVGFFFFFFEWSRVGGASHTHNYFGRLGAAVPVDLCCPGGGCGAPEMQLFQTEVCCRVKCQISKTRNRNTSSYLSNIFFSY